MEFRILGPLEVVENGRQLELGGAKHRALLAVLLLHANEVVSTDRLIDALWEEQSPEGGRKTLQVYVSQLRKALGKDRLLTQAPGYRLRVEPDELDRERVAHLAAEGMPREALALWRGQSLAEFAYQRFAQAEILRLEELRLACVEERIEQDLAVGRHASLVGELEALVQEHPLRERLRAHLMLALYRSGRQAEALEAYRDARSVLTEELGIDPGAELKELQRAVLEHDPSLDLGSAEHGGDSLEAARGVLVGRSEELAELEAAVDDAVAGRGRLVLIVGEPGIGKSRLAEEVARHARARGARVLVGRCWEAGGAPAYWPWVQSLRSYVEESDGDSLRVELGGGAAEVAQIVPEVRDLFPNLAEPTLEEEGARLRLFDAVARFLRNAASKRPLVLVLDDLHAADEPSLLLLQFLARELAGSRLLVVGAYRNVDPSPSGPLTTTHTELMREPVTRTLALAGLGKDDVARFVELTSGEPAGEELVLAIHEETEGNPLFVGEIVRLLAAEGRLDGGTRARIEIPQSVRDVIARRLRHLSEKCNRILVLASVLGREFRIDALARVSAVPEDDLLDTLDEAMSARVVSDVPGSADRLRFAHVLMRDTLYDGLTSARRVRLHRLAVEALEDLYVADPGPYLAELAHHSVAGSEFEKGTDYARYAGDRALALLAYEEAARLYDTALEALELARPADEEERCELLLLLGDAEGRAGNSQSAKEIFFEAARLARRSRNTRMLARAAAAYGGRLVFARAADDERLVPLLEDGLAALGGDDEELHARLLARLAGARRDEHSRERRDALSREAVELARRSGSALALGFALDGRAAAIVGPDTIDECLELANELHDVAERTDDRELLISAYFHRFIARIQIGDVDGARAALDSEHELASELKQPVQLWQAVAARALLALAVGDFAEAGLNAEEALVLGERAQPGFAIPAHRLQAQMLRTFQGRVQEVEPMIRDLAAEYPARPMFRCALAHLEAELGDEARARAALHELAADEFSALPFDLEWLYGMSLLAEVCAGLAEGESAAVLYRLLLPWGALNAVDVPEGMRGSVSRYLGLLASTTNHFDDAERHFVEASAANERMGARPWLAHTQEDYARMLSKRDDPGDRDNAQALLAAALATYRELGMEGPLAKALALEAG